MCIRDRSGLAHNEFSSATMIEKTRLHIFSKKYRFRFVMQSFIFEKKIKKTKSHPFSEGFMHKIRLKTKQKCSKNSKFSFSSKSFQIHPRHRKLIPNHSATLGKWLGSIFDQLNEFKTTFGKSDFRAPKAIFAYWSLRRLKNQRFHGLQNMLGASLIWTFWVHYCRQNKFMYSPEVSPFRIFD